LTPPAGDSKSSSFKNSKRPNSVRIDTTVTVPRGVREKIDWLVEENKWPSRSWAVSKLIQEALKNYPEPKEPQLPF